MSTLRKICLTVLIAGLVAGVAGMGAFSVFSATTKNSDNTFASGTVVIGDNDGGATATPLYTATNQKPLDPAPTRSCIRVTYGGTLTARVKLYASAAISASPAGAFHLQVERGTQTPGIFPACGDFAPTSEAWTGPLEDFPTSLATGRDGKHLNATWATNETVIYRFTITAVNNSTPNARTAVIESGAHDFIWEAENA